MTPSKQQPSQYALYPSHNLLVYVTKWHLKNNEWELKKKARFEELVVSETNKNS